MIKEETKNYEQDRIRDVLKILNSPHPRKIVVAGPGTGKSYLFQQVIKKEKKEGKEKFLAITFIGKLCDELADDLTGLAETMTLHGFAKRFIEANWEKSKYYPEMKNIIKEDLRIKGITEFEVGDDNYKERTLYYKAVGHDDVIHYAVQICKENHSKIPKYDLILIDEFQDFNETEAELVDLLATKNEMLIVGDDDQALYEFKGSFSKFIRDKYDKSYAFFESHTLKYCSRCTEVILKGFHDVIDHFSSRGKLKNRISDKKYICYLPDKKEDNALNRKILLFENVPPGAIATKIRYELPNIIKNQKIKTVLITGEGRTCKKLLLSIAKGLREFGFRNIDHSELQREAFIYKAHVTAGYKMLSEKPKDVLGWRLLLKEIKDETLMKKIILDNLDSSENFIRSLPEDFKKIHESNVKTFKRILEKPESGRNQIAQSSIEKLSKHIITGEREKRNLIIDQLIVNNKHIPRPLANLNITVCNILGAKGLGADVVFLVGFDQGKLPMKKDVKDSEIYQFLVALTRAKKRVYFVNTIGIKVSQFIECIDENDIEIKS